MAYSPLYFSPVGLGSARRLLTNYINASGMTLAQCTPASSDSSGTISAVNVSDELSVDSFIGVTAADILNSALGPVVDAGRIENVALSFSIGDSLYVSKSGFLTNLKPDIGVGGFAAGDWIIFIGVIVKNEFNPLQKDLKLETDVIGQL